jgi:DNA invertase Pin-like site-specific DNA recombinase
MEIKKVVHLRPLPHPKRTAAYARVSSGKDAMLHSLAAQADYFAGYIARQPSWVYAGCYMDEAKTGTKDTRPEFQRLLADCRAGKIDVIITKAVARFARNTLTLLETVRELKSLGIDVYFEQENLHSLNGEGEVMLTIIAAVAQEQSRSVSENSKWRIRKDFQQGLASPHRMLGYRVKHGRLIIRQDEAEVVRQIFAWYMEGYGKEGISFKLAAMGIKRAPNNVRGVLMNIKYMGDLMLQKFFINNHLEKKKMINQGELPRFIVSGSHEPIINKDTFNQVQEEMRRRAGKYLPKPRLNQTYAFTGMIKCGICGAPYRRKIAGSAAQYKKPVWICRTYNSVGKAACASQMIPEAILEAKTAEALKIPVYNETLMKQLIREIRVPAHNRLAFVFINGSVKELVWENPSRRDSWTDEMKEHAGQLAKRKVYTDE